MSGCKSKKDVEALQTPQIIEEEQDDFEEMIKIDNLDKIISVEQGKNDIYVGRGEGYKTATGFEHQNLMLMWGTPPQ